MDLPSPTRIQQIFSEVIFPHLNSKSDLRLSPDLNHALAVRIAWASCELHNRLTHHFPITIATSHYRFSLKQLMQVAQGMLAFLAPSSCNSIVSSIFHSEQSSMTPFSMASSKTNAVSGFSQTEGSRADSIKHNDKMAPLCVEFESVTAALAVVGLWVHESSRVYSDRMVNSSDVLSFQRIIQDVVGRILAQDPFMSLISSTNIGASSSSTSVAIAFQRAMSTLASLVDIWIPFSYSAHAIQHSANTFVSTNTEETISWADATWAKGETGDYLPCYSVTALRLKLLHAMEMNNSINRKKMDLCLFEQAVRYVCRVCRILCLPRGHALLIGVGGSGRQSVVRLSAYIMEYEISCPQFQQDQDSFLQDIKHCILRAGQKGVRIILLLSETIMQNGQYLPELNDILSTGINFYYHILHIFYFFT